VSHHVDIANIIHGHHIDRFVIALTDGSVNLPANSSKTVNANSNSHFFTPSFPASAVRFPCHEAFQSKTLVKGQRRFFQNRA
jgi:hypothetical protein